MAPRDFDYERDLSLERLRQASDAAARALRAVLGSGCQQRPEVRIYRVTRLPDPGAFPRLVEIERN